MQADKPEIALPDPSLDNRALLAGPVGLADGEEHQQSRPLKVRYAQIRYPCRMAEAQPVQVSDLRRGHHGRLQAVVGAGQAGPAGRIPVGRDFGNEYKLAHDGSTATTLISTRMFFSAAPVVARAG